MRILAPLAAIAVLLPIAAAAQEAREPNRAYPPVMPGANEETYKTVGDTRLKLYVFQPPDAKPGDKRAAIVFFFGGGWTSGSPRQFLPQCKYLAQRGMVAIAADYRVASRHQVKAVDCVRDAKSAIRYVRTNATRLGVDPDRIAAAGGSAGGHLAAACGTISGLDEPNEDAHISSKPNAIILFNPAVVLAPVDGLEIDKQRLAGLDDRLGVAPRELSPYHHITAGAPPTVIFHGKADKVVPYATVEAFTKAMQEAENKCVLHGYDGAGHGFFNYDRGDNQLFITTLREADKFLASLGYLQGDPTPENTASYLGEL